jgi:hypothetical protein
LLYGHLTTVLIPEVMHKLMNELDGVLFRNPWFQPVIRLGCRQAASRVEPLIEVLGEDFPD